MKRVLIFILLSFWLLPASAEELPVEYFGLPMIKNVAVSPDGEHIAAMVRNDQGYYDVVVAPFGSTKLTTVARLENQLDRIEYIRWGNNERLLVSASYHIEIAGNNSRRGRLFSIAIDGSDMLELKRRRSKDNKYSIYYSGDRIVSLLEDDPEHILLQTYDPLDDAVVVYKVNIYTSEYEKLFSNDYLVSAWYANAEGEVVLGFGLTEERDQFKEASDLERVFWYRKDSKSSWKKLKEFTIFEDEAFNPVALTGENGFIYVLSDHAIGRMGLYKYNIIKGEYGDLVYAVDGYDLGNVIIDDGELVGVSWAENYRKQHYFDKEDVALHSLVQKTFKGAHVYISSTGEAEKKVVVYAIGDNIPGKYYLLDLEKGKASFWFSQYPYLEGKQLANKIPFEYEASDGMKLNGYLTLPVESDEKKPPLIVFPHGGPQARSYQYFHPWVQFFANRGYAVMQINFRGSTGFGSYYEASGYEEWGQRMQQDVLDAIKWAAKQGTVDTENMCLVGASYGGYVALTASFQTPKMFDCIISLAGISDLPELIADDGFARGATVALTKLIGDPAVESEYKMLQAVSAINHIKQVDVPVLLIHGTRDTRVRFGQSERYYEKAQRLGKDVELVKIENGTHYFDYGPDLMKALEAMDEFLAEHLD